MSKLYGPDGKPIDPKSLTATMERFKDVRLSGMTYSWFVDDILLVDQYGNYLNPPTQVGKTILAERPLSNDEWAKKYIMGNWDTKPEGGE